MSRTKASPELQEYILTKYVSIREFAACAGLPCSTVMSVIERGIKNTRTATLHIIADGLNLDFGALMEGKLAPDREKQFDVYQAVMDLKKELKSKDINQINFNGKPASHKEVCTLIDALEYPEMVMRNRIDEYNAEKEFKETLKEINI